MVSKALDFTQEELSEALLAITSLIAKCEKVAPNLRPGSPQHTLLLRRVQALKLSSDLIIQKMKTVNEKDKGS